MMNKTLIAGSSVLLAAMLAAPMASAQADLTARTFTNELSLGLKFDGGAGIFDPGNSANTCLALISLDLGSNAALLLYPGARWAWAIGTTMNQAGATIGADPTDCLALATPGNIIGTSDFDAYIGGYYFMSPLATGTIFPGTQDWSLCFSSYTGGATPGGAELPIASAGCDITAIANNQATAIGLETGIGTPGGAMCAEAACWTETLYPIDQLTPGLIISCISADIFDPTALAFTPEEDTDYAQQLSWLNPTSNAAFASQIAAAALPTGQSTITPAGFTGADNGDCQS